MNEEKIRIIPLGGQDEFDKKMLVIEINNDIFVVECGKKEPDKTRPGIDHIIPNYKYLLDNKEKVRAYIITHATDSSHGALAYIYKDIKAPIYCSKITQVFIESFASHNHVSTDFNFVNVNPSDKVIINGHKITFFQSASNMSHASGIAIETKRGNIVYSDSFVIDNNSDKDFNYDAKALSDLANEKTLALLLESRYSSNLGYTSPKYRLLPLIERSFKEAQGRIFIALAIPDLYNIVKVINYAIKNKRKIILYDNETSEQVYRLKDLHEALKNIPNGSILPFSEINRISSKDCLVLILGWGERLYHKLELLANKQNLDSRIALNSLDTFIIGTGHSSNTEIVRNEAIDELYKTKAKIVYFNKNKFYRMHASEEDLKTIIALLKPKYYIPVYGTYRELLANARLSLEMGIDLNYNSIFILDNGNILEIDENKAKVLANSVMSGDIYVDGKGVGDISKLTLLDRQKFSDDGAVIFGIMVDENKGKIIGGPDIQMRGLVYLKDNDNLLKELSRGFELSVLEGLKNGKPFYVIEEEVKDLAFRIIRRQIGKTPLILVHIAKKDN